MKTKMKQLIHHTTTVMSVVLVVAVMLVATHAKDVISQTNVRSKQAVDTATAAKTQDDPAQKSVGDLHNHTDKTMLKNFTKSMGDTTSLSARREDHDDSSNDRTLSRRLFEVYMMLQFAYAYAVR